MNEKRSFNQKLDGFFAGKGFYIVLFLCVAIIGVSTYFLLTNKGANVEDNLSQTIVPRASAEPATPSVEVTPPAIGQENPEEPPAASQEDAATSNEVEVWSEQGADAVQTAQFVWPLEGNISLPYSVTALIYNEKMGDWRTNDALEIAAPLGTQVMAVASGTVVSVAQDDRYGMTVVIEHAGGLRSVYSNLASVPTVYEGDSVMTGEVIGAVGVTAPGETPENPHLRLKMTLDGVSVDPKDYLPTR